MSSIISCSFFVQRMQNSFAPWFPLAMRMSGWRWCKRWPGGRPTRVSRPRSCWTLTWPTAAPYGLAQLLADNWRQPPSWNRRAKLQRGWRPGQRLLTAAPSLSSFPMAHSYRLQASTTNRCRWTKWSSWQRHSQFSFLSESRCKHTKILALVSSWFNIIQLLFQKPSSGGRSSVCLHALCKHKPHAFPVGDRGRSESVSSR